MVCIKINLKLLRPKYENNNLRMSEGKQENSLMSFEYKFFLKNASRTIKFVTIK